jgi:hypothetical protein
MADGVNLDYLRTCPDPWVRYRALLDLDDAAPEHPDVQKTRTEIVCHPLVRRLALELADWPGTVLNSHKSAGLLYHKLAFLAEIGLNAKDDEICLVVDKILNKLSPEGIPQLPANIPVHFGGTGETLWAWSLCDAPLQLWTLTKMGLQDHAGLTRGRLFLTGLARPNGWPCKVSEVMGHFRGPGRKDDPCPYATLLMTKLLLQFPEEPGAAAGATTGAACLLDLWQRSLEEHPYMFYMGTDFRKLKAPMIWYDLLHVLDVLSLSGPAMRDPRFAGMLEVMNGKAGPDGLFTPESEWKAWNGWEFGQKKQPSAWLTFLACRINRRARQSL